MSTASPDAVRHLFIDQGADHMPANPFLAGPTAQVTFRASLMPEGHPSHYEVRGEGPDGALTFFRAQGSAGPFDSDPAFVESIEWLTATVRKALEELRAIYGHQLTLDEAPGSEDPAQ